MKTIIRIIGIATVYLSVFSSFALAHCGVCGVGPAAEEKGEKAMTTFSHIAEEATVKDGVKEISYEQFQNLRKSGEDYVLLDALSKESYDSGHIEGAESFYVETINAETANKRLSKDSKIVVYCGSFKCGASTQAAKKLSELGYNVVDYKGGLKEWQEKGNNLVK